MDNLITIYKILHEFENDLNTDAFNFESISPRRLRITETRWCNLMHILSEAGYVSGVYEIREKGRIVTHLIDPYITIAGLEYLAMSSAMKQIRQIERAKKKEREGHMRESTHVENLESLMVQTEQKRKRRQ